jgi:hypothetical protein
MKTPHWRALWRSPESTKSMAAKLAYRRWSEIGSSHQRRTPSQERPAKGAVPPKMAENRAKTGGQD